MVLMHRPEVDFFGPCWLWYLNCVACFAHVVDLVVTCKILDTGLGLELQTVDFAVFLVRHLIAIYQGSYSVVN